MPSNDFTFDEARELVAGDYGRETLDLARSVVAPVWWDDPTLDVTNAIRSGTVFFADTGQEVLGFTAAHVFRACANARAGRCRILEWEVDLSERIVDINDDLDVVTFRVTGREISALSGEKRPLSLWPPRPPQAEKGVLIAGYPGRERRQEIGDGPSFGPYAAGLIATSVTPDGIAIAVEHDRLVDTLRIGLPAPGYDAGGMSGGPVLALFDSAGLCTWRLAGIIYEASPTLDLFLARRADLIAADGTIMARVN